MARFLNLFAIFASAAAQEYPSHGLSWGQWGEWSSCSRPGQAISRRRLCKGVIPGTSLKPDRCLDVLDGLNREKKFCTRIDAHVQVGK